MDYHKDTKVESEASSSIYNGENDTIDASSYSDSFGETRTSNATAMTSSPPRQSMDRTMGEYDPNRIPLDIFSSKPTNVEWSLASTESLFSITLGKSDEPNFPYSYNSSTTYQSMDVVSNNAMDSASQIEADFYDLKFNNTSVDGSEPTGDTAETAQENVEEKNGEEGKRSERTTAQMINEFLVLEPIMEDDSDEDKASPETTLNNQVINEFSVLEPIRKDESNEDEASTDDRTTASISMQGSQDLSTSYAFYRLEDRSGTPMNNPPNTAEIEIEEEAQPQKADQAHILSSGGSLSGFNCCYSWKLVCF